MVYSVKQHPRSSGKSDRSRKGYCSDYFKFSCNPTAAWVLTVLLFWQICSFIPMKPFRKLFLLQSYLSLSENPQQLFIPLKGRVWKPKTFLIISSWVVPVLNQIIRRGIKPFYLLSPLEVWYFNNCSKNFIIRYCRDSVPIVL